MGTADESGTTTNEALAQLLAQYSPDVRDLALKVRVLMRELIPDAVEVIDPKAKLRIAQRLWHYGQQTLIGGGSWLAGLSFMVGSRLRYGT